MGRRTKSQPVRGDDTEAKPKYVIAAAPQIYCHKCDFQTADQNIMNMHRLQLHPEIPENNDPNAVCPECTRTGGGTGGRMVECDECRNWFHWQCVRVFAKPAGQWYCPRNCRPRMRAQKAKNTQKKGSLTKAMAGPPPPDYPTDQGYSVVNYAKQMVSWLLPSAVRPAAAAGNAQQLQQAQQPTPMQRHQQQRAQQQLQQQQLQIQRANFHYHNILQRFDTPLSSTDRQQNLDRLRQITAAAAQLAAQGAAPQAAGNIRAANVNVANLRMLTDAAAQLAAQDEAPQAAGNVGAANVDFANLRMLTAIAAQMAAQGAPQPVNVAPGNIQPVNPAPVNINAPIGYVPPAGPFNPAAEQRRLIQQFKLEEQQLNQQYPSYQVDLQQLRGNQQQRQLAFQGFCDTQHGSSKKQ